MLMLVHPGACLLLHNWSTDWHAGPRRSTFLSLSDQIAIWDSTVLCLVEDLHSMTVLECWSACTAQQCWSAPGDRLPACLPVTPSSGSKLNQSPASFHFVTGIIITTVISSAYMNMNIKDFDPNTQCRGISMSHYLYFYLPSLKSDLCLQSSRMGAPLWVTWFTAIIFQYKVPANWRPGLNV